MFSTISSDSASLNLGQLGANSSHHFLGPVRGVLPMGPNLNDLATVNTLQVSPINDPQTMAVIVSYNYTLDHQGPAIDVSCIYDTQSPVKASEIPLGPAILGINGSCDGLLAHAFVNETLVAISTDNTFMFWACKSIPTAGRDPLFQLRQKCKGYIRQRISDHLSNSQVAASVPDLVIIPVLLHRSSDSYGLRVTGKIAFLSS